MKKLIALWGNTKYKECPKCGNLGGFYDRETKKIVCSMCGVEFKKLKGDK